MPEYTYSCKTCGKQTIVEVDPPDRKDSITCECGAVADIGVAAMALVAGKDGLYVTKRRKLHKRLSEREERLKEMESSGAEGKERASKFRQLSKLITGDKF